jgi:hypothetical protein
MLVRDLKGRIGWLEGPYEGPYPSRDQPEFRFKLTDVAPYRGRLLDTVGKPIAGAVVRPYHLLFETYFSEPVDWDSYFPPTLAERCTARTATDGSFVLPDMPKEGDLEVTIEAGAFGRCSAVWELKKPVTCRLAPAGTATGRCILVPGRRAVAGIGLHLLGHSFANAQSDFVSHHGCCRTGADGTFRFEGLPPGEYELMLDPLVETPYYLPQALTLTIKAGHNCSEIEVQLHSAAEVEGEVVDADSGQGIQDVWVSLVAAKFVGREGPIWVTDKQGRFQGYVPPGKYRICLSLVPETHFLSWRFPDREIEIPGNTRIPPIPIPRAVVAEGVIVDDEGRPVADAEVLACNEAVAQVRHITDAQGRFKIKGLPQGQNIAVRARTSIATSDGARMIDPHEQSRVVVSSKYAFAIRGQVIDPSGSPISGGDVCLYTTWSRETGDLHLPIAGTRTDHQGRFAFTGLWPGDQYEVYVEPMNPRPPATGKIIGARGQTHDVGRIVGDRNSTSRAARD